MTKKKQSVLSKIRQHCTEAERETVTRLSEGPAQFFVDLWNDSFTITDAVGQAYSQEKRLGSLLCFRLENCLTFSMELYWLHMLFSYANYPMVFQRLRFLWEMIYRAYYADCYAGNFGLAQDGPGLVIDEKIAWLEEKEENGDLNWRRVVKPVLDHVLPETKDEKLQSPRTVWNQLNKYVHPSSALLDKMIDFDGMPMNRFNEAWARETIEAATRVFDFMWCAVIRRFPKCVQIVAHDGLTLTYELTNSLESREHC